MLERTVIGLAASMLAVASPAFAQPCDGLVAHYAFEGDTLDASGLGNHGAPFGGPAYGPGMVGQALILDGVDDFVFIPDSPSLNPAAAITLTAWYRPASFAGSGNDPIIDKGAFSHDYPYYQYHLGVTGDQYGVSARSFGGSAAVNGNPAGAGTAPGAYTVGQWSHVAATFDGSRIKFYLNGQLVDDNPAIGSIVPYGRPVLLGRFVNLPQFFLPGAIDEVRIYNRALSAGEIGLMHDHPALEPQAAPASVNVCGGGTVQLEARTLLAAGTTFQWSKDGTDLPGETGQFLTLSNVGGDQTGSYRCQIGRAHV